MVEALVETQDRFHGKKLLCPGEFLELRYSNLKNPIKLNFQLVNETPVLEFTIGSRHHRFAEPCNIGYSISGLRGLTTIGKILGLTPNGIEIEIFETPVFETPEQLKERMLNT